MAQKKKEQEDVHLENVQEALSKSEAFIEQYRKQLVIGVAVVVAVVVAVILFNTYYLVPRAQEAQEALLPAVAAFENDQYELALRGDESFDGFAAIVDDYGMTDAGELAAYYAGVCAYQLGEYDTAVDYLAKFDNSSVNLAPAARMLQGDAYCNLEEYKKEMQLLEKLSDGEKEAVTLSAMAGEVDAQRRLIQAYLPQVVEISKLYSGQGVFLEDLIGEGNVALAMGVTMLGCLEHAKEAEGMLIKMVMDAMEECIADNLQEAEKDKKVLDRVNKVAEKARELAEELHRKVTVEELAQETGISQKAIEDAMRMSGFAIEDLEG